ncbi:unnamed protein product [Plutella xylostella]|uniref:(diamondback moth) hypothetical protein n=1 Tax=Plutella xylostella TaxID=51655 RepID=A0A8S4D899_PLUXY|nr:unnamed protein product [Plutella xylostella]
MTIIATMLSYPNSCVKVAAPFGSWATSVQACCPNCRLGFSVSVEVHGTRPSLPPAPHRPHYPCHLQRSQSLKSAPMLITPKSTNDSEIQRLNETLKVLRISGWYYGNLDWQGAQVFLKEASPGAFIIRDSGDKNFIFSLSVQTERGPTSVRLHYKNGFFRLDSEKALQMYMPRFRCVIELVQHYCSKSAGGTVWVDRKGCPHSPVLLSAPLRKAPPTLAHAARLAVHKTFNSAPKIRSCPKYSFLPLPTSILDYLGEYPYSI